MTAISLQDIDKQEHFELLEALDKINQVIAQSDSLETMLQKVLEKVLDILNCDRSWLLYPCDPNSLSWSVPMERNRPHWPGAGKLDNLPMTPEVSEVIDVMSQAESSVVFDETNECFRKSKYRAQFSIDSQLLICLRPKIGKPWILGFHHCETNSQISQRDIKIFEAISKRISDSLSTLLSLKQLTESEERFRTLVEHAPEAIFVLDTRQEKFVQVNDKLSSLLGYSKADLINRHWKELVSVSPQEEVLFQSCLVGKTPSIECEFIDSQNRPISCETKLVALPSSHNHLIRGSVTDITQRKKTESIMRQLTGAVTQMDDAIAITNRYGIIEYVNPSFERITGYSSADILGQNLSILRSDQHCDQFYKDFWTTITAGNVYYDTFINRRQNGTLYHEKKSVSPIIDESGRITHYISSGREISKAT